MDEETCDCGHEIISCDLCNWESCDDEDFNLVSAYARNDNLYLGEWILCHSCWNLPADVIEAKLEIKYGR